MRNNNFARLFLSFLLAVFIVFTLISLYNIFFIEGEIGKGGAGYIFNCASGDTVRKCSFLGYLEGLTKSLFAFVPFPFIFLLTFGINRLLRRK